MDREARYIDSRTTSSLTRYVVSPIVSGPWWPYTCGVAKITRAKGRKKIVVLVALAAVTAGLAAVASAAGPEPQLIRMGDGRLVEGCPSGTDWVSTTFDYFEAAGGGTVDNPTHPYGSRIEDLPYESELVAVGSSALVRPHPEGSGNDVVYELTELPDGTFMIATVSYCITTEEDGTAITRGEFSIQPTELTQELIDQGAFFDEEGNITDG